MKKEDVMETAKKEEYYWQSSEEEDRETAINEHLSEYGRANSTQRLHLWLSHRDLRREFDGLADMLEGKSRDRRGWFVNLKRLFNMA